MNVLYNPTYVNFKSDNPVYNERGTGGKVNVLNVVHPDCNGNATGDNREEVYFSVSRILIHFHLLSNYSLKDKNLPIWPEFMIFTKPYFTSELGDKQLKDP